MPVSGFITCLTTPAALVLHVNKPQAAVAMSDLGQNAEECLEDSDETSGGEQLEYEKFRCQTLLDNADIQKPPNTGAPKVVRAQPKNSSNEAIGKAVPMQPPKQAPVQHEDNSALIDLIQRVKRAPKGEPTQLTDSGGSLSLFWWFPFYVGWNLNKIHITKCFACVSLTRVRIRSRPSSRTESQGHPAPPELSSAGVTITKRRPGLINS